jgi:hypothetical protein
MKISVILSLGTHLRVRAERLFKVEVVLDENSSTNTIALTT